MLLNCKGQISYVISKLATCSGQSNLSLFMTIVKLWIKVFRKSIVWKCPYKLERVSGFCIHSNVSEHLDVELKKEKTLCIHLGLWYMQFFLLPVYKCWCLKIWTYINDSLTGVNLVSHVLVLLFQILEININSDVNPFPHTANLQQTTLKT